MMLKSVLQSISPPSSKVDGDSISESANEDESSCRRRLVRDHFCLPIYVRQQVNQIKQVVTDFVSGWKLPFVQRQQIEAELSKSITEAVMESHNSSKNASDPSINSH